MPQMSCEPAVVRSCGGPLGNGAGSGLAVLWGSCGSVNLKFAVFGLEGGARKSLYAWNLNFYACDPPFYAWISGSYA